MKLLEWDWKKALACYLLAGVVITALIINHEKAWIAAKQKDTAEAYGAFIKANPDNSHVKEAQQRIGQFKYAFRPKFFLIYEGKDLSREVGFFNFSITDKQDDAETLAFINAPEPGTSGGCSVTVRLVEKKTKRERTIRATSTGPEWVRVAVGSGRVTSSGGGSHTIDGIYHEGSRNGQGLLMQDILDYAQTVASEKP